MLKSQIAADNFREIYLMKFRKCSNYETLDKVFERIQDKLNEEDEGVNKIVSLNGAYDHRRAELYMRKIYDKIPAAVWKLIPDNL